MIQTLSRALFLLFGIWLLSAVVGYAVSDDVILEKITRGETLTESEQADAAHLYQKWGQGNGKILKKAIDGYTLTQSDRDRMVQLRQDWLLSEDRVVVENRYMPTPWQLRAGGKKSKRQLSWQYPFSDDSDSNTLISILFVSVIVFVLTSVCLLMKKHIAQKADSYKQFSEIHDD